jgi:hypothetical protein
MAVLIVEKWTGHFVSYSPSFNRDELEWINTRVEEVMRTGEDLPLNVRNMDREPLKKRLAEVREYRRSLGDTISSPSLPLTTLAAQRSGPLLQLSDPQEYCRQLLTAVLDEYRVIVERNFPTIRQHFSIYSLMPARLIACLTREPVDRMDEAELFWCPSETGANEVEVHLSQHARFDRQTFSVTTPAGLHHVRRWASMSADDLLTGPVGHRLRYEYPGAVVRRWVYDLLRKEYREAERAFLGASGI